jgi:hypothetical protein
MTTTLDDLTAGARTFLRDFPQYFEVDTGVLNTLTVRLPHPLVSSQSLQVYVNTAAAPGPPPIAATSALTTDWSLDERSGLIKLTNTADLGKSAVVAGYYYTWFTDSDLAFHVRKSVNELTYGADVATFTPVHYDVVMLGGVVHALWSLAMELSLDIDVSTPEGMFIPARQRFTQVLQMLQYWESEYSDKAAMLNMGLGALQVFQLRRVAYMTGRYVPVYKSREFDDPDPPERLYPPIPEGVQPSADIEVEVVETLYPAGLT